MNEFDIKVGYAESIVNPPMGIGMGGYFVSRYADGILDNLEIRATAIRKNKKTVIIMTVDNLGLFTDYCDLCRKAVVKATHISYDCVFIHSTHTHTGPFVNVKSKTQTKQEKIYSEFLITKFADVAKFALNDLTPAKVGYGIGKAENISFVRRYVMKDGSIQTNPGVNNPDIVKPVGKADEGVNVLRFTRQDGKNVVLVNFGTHPDVIGGCKISADWPGFTRRIVEKALDNTKCIFINGAQGDVNHVNVSPKGGDMNDLVHDFDDVYRGYGHSHYMGSVIAGAVLTVFDKVKYFPATEIKVVQRELAIPSNMPEPKDMEQAFYIEKMHKEGRDSELPYKGMMLATYIGEAERMIELEHGPEFFKMTFGAISIGNVALFAIPGEPFTGIGEALKKAEGYEMVMPMCITNGREDYFPMKDSFDEGGYEARCSRFKAGVGELIISEGLKMLKEIKQD